MTIRSITLALALTVPFIPAVSSADSETDILANTVGRILIENTIGNPVDPKTEQDARRIIRNPNGVIDYNTRPDVIAEKIRNQESQRRLDQLMNEQRENISK